MTNFTQNNLGKQPSPYLQQHANNPVHWQPWSKEVFVAAKKQNKLVIVSIGYSSCHWCHVMEHESFEDTSVAAVMNENFLPVKVDREERPDIDDIYMTAAQLMTGRGGWPLNVITLPDGRPVWAGTYVPKDRWLDILGQISELYRNDSAKFEEYAQKLTQGIKQAQLLPLSEGEAIFKAAELDSAFKNWQTTFDREEGGANRAPKFPMPGAYQFLLHYGESFENEEALQQVKLSLRKMAYGGIYDQVGGGFARYSTDSFWKVPHFEKMLYDNAQLISLYSQAYRKFEDPLYKQIVLQSLEYIKREMTHENGAFYSALDADSEGQEGKYYIWTEEELHSLIPEKDWSQFSDYYNVNEKGYWENGQYILLRNKPDSYFQKTYNYTDQQWQKKVKQWRQILLQKRQKREKPGLDDKSLTSWNALMISAYLEAYRSFGHEDHLMAAQKNARWILDHQLQKDGTLLHSFRNGQSYIDGLIEDYAFCVQAFLDLFELTGAEQYLYQAEEWMQLTGKNFEDKASGLFYSRSLASEQLIAKSQETNDNVIPGANSVMAHNLFRLSHYLGHKAYHQQAEKMLNQVKSRLLEYPESYYNWGRLMAEFTQPFYEVAIAGPQASEKLKTLSGYYLPQTLLIATESESKLPLLENRYDSETTRIFICQNRACKLPVEEVKKALESLDDANRLP